MLEQFQKVCMQSEQNPWAIRILTEVEYLRRLYEESQRPVPELLQSAVAMLEENVTSQGTITKTDVLRIEEYLLPLQHEAKELTLYCVSHAHIDMNWMWGTPETVGIVIDTFRTMLKLLEEFPDFIYSQSQAETYRIIEKYAPSMLPEIRRRIQEGRWELTASTWVEPDKNMISAESMSRHILYTKRYLQGLFGIAPEDLEIDFEPDTFGHSANIPEILSQGGVRYYYFCRGRKEGPVKIFWWQASSGAKVLACEEPYWYSTVVKPNAVLMLPRFTQENHTKCGMMIYGVSDHGGGPTRKDLQRILDMQTWPLMPEIRFSSLRNYFKKLEEYGDAYPVLREDMNPLYTGCYTSQAKIKRANRVAEDRLYDAEALSVFGGQEGVTFGNFELAWRNTLFNQFHDILPGSNSADSRDQAMGLHQEAMSYIVGNSNLALFHLAERMKTNGLGESTNLSGTAIGAGVGEHILSSDVLASIPAQRESGFGSVSRGDGNLRAFVLTNTTSYVRDEVITVTVWDWPYSLRQTEVVDATGQSLSFSVQTEKAEYWWHTFAKLQVRARVPALGCTTIYVRYAPDKPLRALQQPDHGQRPDEPICLHSSFERKSITSQRRNRIVDEELILENDLVRAHFHSEDMSLVSLVDKKSGEELIHTPSALFRLITESDHYGKPSWRLGPYGKIEVLNHASVIRVREKNLDGPNPYVSYDFTFGDSSAHVTVSLTENSPVLRFSIQVLWREYAEKDVSTPLLQFYVPFSFSAKRYRYGIPGGAIDREEIGCDVPGNGYAAPVSENTSATLGLISDCKYGYRGNHNSLSLSLLRGSYVPDPCMDIGTHTIEIGLAVTQLDQLEKLSRLFSHQVYVTSTGIHDGDLGEEHAFFGVEGAHLLALKRSEDEIKAVVLRLQGQEKEAVITAACPISSAAITDVTETKKTNISLKGNQVCLSLKQDEIATLYLALK